MKVPVKLTDKQRSLLEELYKEMIDGDGNPQNRSFKERMKEFFEKRE